MTVPKMLRFGIAKLLKNFSWRTSAPRMAVDVALINLSVISAFLLWFAVYIVFIPNVDSRRLAHTFRVFYLDNVYS